MATNASSAQRALKLGYGLVPIVAGADKFTNLLVDWEKYLSPSVAESLPVSKRTFMRLVGLVEIAAGALVLSKRTRLGAFTVAAWLTAITGNLVIDGDWDIAARDALLAVGAAALGMLSPAAVRKKEPASASRGRPEGMAAVLH